MNGQWRDVTLLKVASGLDSCIVIFSLHLCVVYVTGPDTILVFKIFYGVFGEGTRLAMPKTICVPDSSSLKPGSGATEGVLD